METTKNYRKSNNCLNINFRNYFSYRETFVVRVEAAIFVILSGMGISYYVDHPVYRYRDIEKLGRICKTEGSWTKTWPLEQLCTMCAPLVRLSSPPYSFPPTISQPSLFVPRPRASLSFPRLIRYTHWAKNWNGMEWNPRVLLLFRGAIVVPPSPGK